MSRIRSIHPGIWTDEEFMGLSAYARLLLIGLWTEAWDDGVFEWKPLTLKARIFPVDPVDVAALLAELLDAGVIARIESGQKQPGVIKNFQKYQRPKKPNSSGLMRDEWLDYVGAKAVPEASDEDSSEPVPNQFPTGGEKSPQMEDGGWKREDEQNTPPNPQGGAEADLFDEFISAYPASRHSKPDRAKRQFSRLTPELQRLAVSQARVFRAKTEADRQSRQRSAEAHAEFVPGMDGWLRDGAWKAVTEPTPIVPMTKLDRERDAALWAACELVMGRPAPTSGMTWSFLNTVIEQAREVA
jgi:hypothetical protein